MRFQVILAFGDSVTMGLRDDRGGWPARLWETQPRIVYNMGVDGETSGDVLSRFAGETRPRANRRSAIIFSVGLNDSSRMDGKNRVSREDYRQNLVKLFGDATQQFPGNVYCVGLSPIDQSKTVPFMLEKSISFFEEDRRNYDEILREVSGSAGVTYIPLDGIGLEGHLSEDGVHPLPSGYALLAQRIGTFIPKP